MGGTVSPSVSSTVSLKVVRDSIWRTTGVKVKGKQSKLILHFHVALASGWTFLIQSHREEYQSLVGLFEIVCLTSVFS